MELILSILTGGATGLIGTVISKVFGFIEAKQKLKQQEVEWAHEQRLHELNMQSRGAEMEHEATIAGLAAEKSMMASAHRHDTAIGQGGPLLTFILRMVRPVLTFGLVGLVAYFWLDLSPEDELVDVHALKTKLVDTVVYLASAAVLFWFGSRPQRSK